MPEHEPSICPRCKQSFLCKVGNISTCDCLAIKLTSAQLSYLSDHFEGCLCNGCLAWIAEHIEP